MKLDRTYIFVNNTYDSLWLCGFPKKQMQAHTDINSLYFAALYVFFFIRIENIKENKYKNKTRKPKD